MKNLGKHIKALEDMHDDMFFSDSLSTIGDDWKDELQHQFIIAANHIQIAQSQLSILLIALEKQKENDNDN